MENQQSQKPEKSYGGRSKRQWIVIYLVLAIVVYAIIYFVFIRHSGDGGAFGY